MKLVSLIVLGMVACGGAVESPEPDAGAVDVRDAAAEASTDAPGDVDGEACWRCADRRWRNVCTREIGTDADSCARCGEHCDGG